MHDQPKLAPLANLEDYDWGTCPCGRQLRSDEFGRAACFLCQDRADMALRQLPGPRGLYAQLGTRLAPGRSGDNVVVSASRTAPVPLRLDVLNLMTERGPVIAPLEAWVRDWEKYGRAELDETGSLQQRLDHAVRTLRFNLAWAAGSHPAFFDFTLEVTALVWQCERQITGERKERPIAVACPCGAVLHVTVSTPKIRCRSCSAQYTRTEAFDLPLATRTAA